MDQNRTPLFDAVKNYIDQNVKPFHVPGHKQGLGISELREYIGNKVLEMDVNGMEDLDFANNPTGVIWESEKLLADAFGASYAHFLVNGTTSGVQTMIMSACQPGDKIIIPRNAHKSTIGAIILSGAVPVYVQPEFNEKLGIAMGVSVDNLQKTINKHPHAKAVFLINPTYYGVASDLKSLVKLAHDHDMAVLVDEAHGAHMSFHENFPITAMQAGADMSAASTHKTAGSMTQSAVLLLKSKIIAPERVKAVLDLSFTTSASYVLMCSIDVARKQLAISGQKIYDDVLGFVRDARDKINSIEGLYAFGKDMIGSIGCFDFDETKLGICVKGLGFTGYEMEICLREEYNIQVELADLYNILAVVGIGDTKNNLDSLVNALKVISGKTILRDFEYSINIPKSPPMIVSPRDAFFSPKRSVKLDKCEGEISGEMVMAYPPGIPLVCMGEKITREVIAYIKVLKKQKCQLQGTADTNVDYIRVLGN